MGAIQSDVTHVVHRVRPVPAAVADGHVAHDALHDLGRDVLRSVPRTRHQSYTES